MNVGRMRYVVCAAMVAAAAGALPARADTYAHSTVDCAGGQTASALFTENDAQAAWGISATYANGSGSAQTTNPEKLHPVSRGTYRVTYTPSSSTQRIISIHVHSSNSVQASAGQQCSDRGGAVSCTDCHLAPGTPADEFIPPLPDDVPAFDVQPIVDVVDPLAYTLDAMACPVLAAVTTDFGVARVDSEGDVYAADGKVWDCPPYDVSR